MHAVVDIRTQAECVIPAITAHQYYIYLFCAEVLTPSMSHAHPKLILQVLWLFDSCPQLLDSNGSTQDLQWKGTHQYSFLLHIYAGMTLAFHWLDNWLLRNLSKAKEAIPGILHVA